MDSEQTQSIDDLFESLISMGFDYEDCKQAVSSGLLSVPEAVEWILNGKPKLRAGAPTLQLRKSTKSMFDSSGLHSTSPENEDNGSGNCEMENAVAETHPEMKVVGTIRSEEQRKQWDKFHEKQRLEAEQIAKIERLKKREERSNVLQQIALDRMERKQLHTLLNSSDLSEKADAQIVKKPTPPNATNIPTRTTIQVRCPNSSVIKREFDSNEKLGKLWEEMKVMFPNSEEIAFLQPFPRYEFSAQDLDKTYSELGLVPSGSLVLSIQWSNAHIAEEQRPTSPPIVMNRRRRAAPALVDVPRQPRMDEDAIFGLPDQRNEGLNPRVPPPPPDNLIAHMHRVLEDAGLGHVWGSGHKLNNNQNNEEAHHNENPLELAREAALQRAFNQEPEVIDVDNSVSFVPINSVPSLVQLCINKMVKLITNPCTCPFGLTLPANIAEKMLQQMKKSLVLSPKTLHSLLSCHLDSVVLDFYPYATNELLYALRLHTTVRHLSLVSCSLINDSGLQHLTSLKRILSLNLRECNQVTDLAFHYFSELQNLTSLNLEGTKVTDYGLYIYLTNKPVCLQHLNLGRTLVTDKVLESLAGLSHLRSLSLDETQVTCLQHLCHLNQLESLSIRAIPVQPDALLWLGKLPKLNALNISQLPHVNGDKALELIKDLKLTSLQLPSRLTTSDLGLTFISEMPLASLDLTNYNLVTDAGIRCLRNMSSLKILLLNNTKLTDVGLLSLENLRNLEVLYLDRTAITDNGTLVFKGMQRLTELSLAFTNAGKICLKNGNLNCCNLLSRLNLSYTQVTDKGLQKLCLPKLSLISLDGTRIRGDPHLLLTECPQLRHISAKNIVPRGLYDSDNE